MPSSKRKSSFAKAIRIVLFSTTIPSILAQTCYNFDGSVHDVATVCTPNAVSHCCTAWDVCVGDGLCLSQYGTLYLESCTDKTFKGDGCPKYCVEERRNGTAGTGDILPCGYDNGWLFCCGIGCCSGTNPVTFHIGNASNIYEDRFECAVQGIPTIKASISAAASTGTSSPTTAGAASTASGSVAGVTASATTIPPNNCAASLDDSQTKITFGVGIGLGLGVPLLVALALLYFEHTKRIRAEGQLAGIGGAPAYPQALADPKYGYRASEVAINPTELQGQPMAYELTAGQQYRGP